MRFHYIASPELWKDGALFSRFGESELRGLGQDKEKPVEKLIFQPAL
jgi:hypothetical protein